MKFGLALAPTSDIGRVRELAAEAEELGFEYVAVGEHVLFHGASFNSLLTLSHVAAATSRIGLVSGVSILPLYPAVLLAKMASLVDFYSDGRLSLGVGAGGEYEKEFEACGIPVAERGARMDEALPIVRDLLAGKHVTCAGRFAKLDDVVLDPPARQSRVALWVAGRKEAATRRAGRFGDAWFPYLVSAGHLRRGIESVHRHAERAGRSPEDVGAVALLHASVDASSARAKEWAAAVLGTTYQQDFAPLVDKLLVAGTTDECRERIAAYRDAGADAVIFRIAVPPDRRTAALSLFITEVLTAFR